MPGNCGYQKAWEKNYPWLSCVKTDKKLAHCGICPKSFRIDNSGIGQVKSHAKSHESDTGRAMQKVQYVIKFGIADYVKKKLINDAKDTPYSFLFDETTTSQVKKQYDT